MVMTKCIQNNYKFREFTNAIMFGICEGEVESYFRNDI
jgi:hypothetical protein